MRQARLLAALRPAIEGVTAAAHQGARLTVACDATRLLSTQPPAHTASQHQPTRSPARRLQHTAVLIDQDEDEDEQDVSTAQQQQLGGQSHGGGSAGGAGGQRPGSPRGSKEAEPFRRTATEGPLALYEEGRATGRYRSDPRQEVCIQLLQDVYLKLRQEYPAPQRPSGLTLVDNVGVTQGKSSWWTGVSHLLRSSSGLVPQPHLQPAHHVEGLYLYGGVGTGKTMLMDLFVESAPKEFQVRRCHFHDFMLDAHTKLQQFKADPNPLLRAADSIAASTKVLCLDELVVNDVGDAMILNRLFTRLWQQGLTLVATSNRDPDALYKGGLQRHLFLPFITGLKKECTIHDMASPTDYRRLAHHHQGLYLLTPDRENLLQERLHQLAAQEHRPLAPAHVEVAMGRTLRVPAAAGRVCHFTFEDLCGKPLGAADYIAIAKNYHTLLISGLPAFGASNLPLAYRFVTLIDVLYEHRVRMVVSAAAPPFELFEKVVTQAEARGQPAGAPEDPEMSVDDRLAFTRERTISRLTEMGSLEYLLAHAEAHAPELVLALKEAQDRQKKAGGRG